MNITKSLEIVQIAYVHQLSRPIEVIETIDYAKLVLQVVLTDFMALFIILKVELLFC